MAILLSVFCMVLMFAIPTHALTPPNNETLCNISGKILAITHEKIQNSTPTILIVEIEQIAASDHNVGSTPCKIPALVEDSHFSGIKHAGYYRLCQEDLSPLRIHQNIGAVVGRNIGGGRYCIENIKLLDE